MATLRNIADELNISVPVVSRVLNGKSDVRASEETKRRILEIAQRLHYHPTASARALATGRSMQIAVLADAHGHYQNASDRYPDLRGLVEAAESYDYRVVVIPLHHGKAGERQLERLFTEKVCDGLCVISYQLELPHLNVLKKQGIPFVVIGGSAHSAIEEKAAAGTVRVDINNRRFAREAVLWLSQQGHSRIAFDLGDLERPHLHLLRDSYHETMTSQNLEPLVISVKDEAEIAAFAKSGKATAVMVRDMPGAAQWILALARAGVRVPQDITILGLMELQDYLTLRKMVDTSPLAFHLYKHHALGEIAVDILVKWAGGNAPDTTQALIAPGPLGWDAQIRDKLGEMLAGQKYF